ncbi:hypothetical protein KCU99_g176, partial [Aureobasidium melanogenum]
MDWLEVFQTLPLGSGRSPVCPILIAKTSFETVARPTPLVTLQFRKSTVDDVEFKLPKRMFLGTLACWQRAFEIHICIVEGEILLCPRLSDQASQWESDKRSVVVSRGEVGNDTPTTRQEAPRRSFRIWQPWDLDVSSSVLIRTIER